MKKKHLLIFALLIAGFLLPAHSLFAAGRDWGVKDTTGISPAFGFFFGSVPQDVFSGVFSGPNAGIYLSGDGDMEYPAMFERRNLSNGSLIFVDSPYSLSCFTCESPMEGVTADNTGIYTMGFESYPEDSASSNYTIVQKYDSSGNLVWSKTIQGWIPVSIGLLGSRLFVLDINVIGSYTEKLWSFNTSSGAYSSDGSWGLSTYTPNVLYPYTYFWPGFIQPDTTGKYLYHTQDFTLYKTNRSGTSLWSTLLADIKKRILSPTSSYASPLGGSFSHYLNNSVMVLACGSGCLSEEIDLSSGAITPLPPVPDTLAIDDTSLYAQTISTQANSGGYVHITKRDLSSNQIISTTTLAVGTITSPWGGIVMPAYTVERALVNNGTMYTYGRYENSSNFNWPAYFMNVGFIDSISPTSGSANGGTKVTITGTNFLGTTAVKFGNTPATSFTVNSPTKITAVAPAGSAGIVPISVMNSLDTKSINYTYIASCTNNATNPPACNRCSSGDSWNGTHCIAVCKLPWGGSIDSGSSVTAYKDSSVHAPATCVSQTRTCTDGSLSGSYTNKNCSMITSCDLPWGGTLSSGKSVTAYQTSQVEYPATCVSQTRTCTDGSLSGSYSNQSCLVKGNSACSLQPTGTLTATPDRVPSGGASVTLSWSVSGYGSAADFKSKCEIIGSDGTSKSLTGAPLSCDVSGTVQESVKGQTTYQLECAGGTVLTNSGQPAQTTVNTAGTFSEF